MKDSILTGVLFGLPLLACSLVAGYLLRNHTFLFNKPALPYLVAIALNMLLMRFLSLRDHVKTVRGLMIATFAFMFVVFLFKIHPFR